MFPVRPAACLKHPVRWKGIVERQAYGPEEKDFGAQLSISRTDAEWHRVRRVADAAGKAISRYLIDCATEAVAFMERDVVQDALPTGGDGLVPDAVQQ